MRPTTFLSDGIKKLVDCYKKWMELQQDYVEK
jgi:hypothetical protein